MHPPDTPQEVEPPKFLIKGGQSRAYYRIDYTSVSQTRETFTGTFYGFGPLSSTGNVYRINSANPDFGQQFYTLNFHDGAGRPDNITLGSQNYVTFKDSLPYTNIVNITHADGKPDTGGNPLPLNLSSYSAPGNSLGALSAAPPSAAPSPHQERREKQLPVVLLAVRPLVLPVASPAHH